MGERNLAADPSAHLRGTLAARFTGRDLAAWVVLLAWVAAALVMAWGFVVQPAPPPGSSADPFAAGDTLAGWIRLAPGRGSALLAVIAVGIAALLAAWRLEPRLGPAAPLWVAVWLAVSATPAALFWTPVAAILLAAALVAFALAIGEGGGPPRELPQMWAPEPGIAASVARFAVAGALLGLLAAAHPLHLVLLAAAAVCAGGAGGARVSLRRGSLLVGAGAVLALRLALGGAESWLAGLAVPSFEPKLLGWNLLYLSAGRNIGLLVLFPALVLLAFGAGRDRARRVLLAACAVELLLLVLSQPFDFPGLPAAIGNRTFLPLYGALVCALGRPVGRAPALVVAALGTLVLWPLLSAPRAHPLAESGRARWTGGLAQRYLPFETTLRSVPGAAEVMVQGVRLRTLNDAVWPAGGGGSLRLRGDAAGELMLAGRDPLGSLLAEFARDAPPRLEVKGGELGEMILRPDGGVAFEVLLGKPRAVHPTYWSDRPQYFYAIELKLPGAAAKAVAFSVAPQRKPSGRP